MAAAVAAATLATVAAAAAVAAAVEASAAEARPRSLCYAFVARTLPLRLGFTGFALAAHATRSWLGRLPRGSALPTHNNQTA